MRTRRLVPAVAGVLIALGAGCRKQDARFPFPTRDVPSSKDENGWPLYEQSADGFALALPPDWVALELNAAALDQALELGIRSNPDFQVIERQIRQQIAAGIKFMGMDKAGVQSGSPANVHIMKTALDAGASLQNAVDGILEELNGMSTIERPIARERVTLKAGQGERLRYILPVKRPDGRPVRAAIIQYVLAPGKDLYVITCTTTADQVERYQPTFEAIALSFRVVK
jgi:hypothetical protein